MHTGLATVWSNHWPISQHLQDERLNAWEACPWHGKESWKPNPAQAKENMISKNNFGRLEKIPWLANFFPDCAWKPCFSLISLTGKIVKFFPDSLISRNPVNSPVLCFLCGCFGTASPWCVSLGQTCIWYAPCIGIFLAYYTATVWPHLYWVSPLMAYGQWWFIHPLKNSNDGIFLAHVEFQELHILCCCRTTPH